MNLYHKSKCIHTFSFFALKRMIVTQFLIRFTSQFLHTQLCILLFNHDIKISALLNVFISVIAMKKPEIIGTMEPLTIKDGETGQLKVKASGEPKPKITW